MSPELEQKLVEKYPKLLREYGGSPQVTCMCFGFQHSDGWLNIVDHLLGYLDNLQKTPLHINYTQEYKEQHREDKDYYQNHCSYKLNPPQIVLDQAKSKYGTLRVYHHTDLENEIPEEIRLDLDSDDLQKKVERYNDKIDFAIDYAEYQSSVTCEVTGKEGKLYTKGWHVVLSDEEAIKLGYDPKEGSSGGLTVEEY